MPQTSEGHFPNTPEEKPKSPKERMGLALAEEIRRIQEKMQEEGETTEGYKRIIELAKRIKKIYEIIGWQLEGELTEENVLAKYQAGEWVRAANFSPGGDMVVVGGGRRMISSP